MGNDVAAVDNVMSRLSLQVRVNVGSARLVSFGEFSQRMDYDTYDLQLASLYPSGAQAAGYWAAGAQFSHADEAALGSSRTLVHVEGGFRGSFLTYFIVEAGAAVELGGSSLNFGGGDNPESSVDAGLAAVGRVMVDAKYAEVGGMLTFSVSPVRAYSTMGWGVSVVLPLAVLNLTEEKPKGDCEALVQAGHAVDDEVLHVSAEYTKVSMLRQEVETVVAGNNIFSDLHRQAKAKLESHGFVCVNTVPENFSPTSDALPPLPGRPTGGTCAEELSRLGAYQKQLAAYKRGLQAAEKSYLDALIHVKTDLEKLASWDPDCTSPIKTDTFLVTSNNQLYWLNPKVSFANNNPHLALQKQQKLVPDPTAADPDAKKAVDAGYDEPALDEWIRFLNDHPQYKIRLDGYASDKFDRRIRYDNDQILSLATARVQNVHLYLTTRGKKDARSSDGLDISDSFVPDLIGPLLPERMKNVIVIGHDLEGLRKYAMRVSGGNLNVMRMPSDPFFRTVQISVWEMGDDEELHEISLDQLGKRQ